MAFGNHVIDEDNTVINRRTFVKTGAAAAYLATQGNFAYADIPQGTTDIPWQRKLRRIAQVNMTEHDPAVMNVEEWADYMARLRVGATFISVTGIIAFYQTKVPFHRKGKYLGNRDFFGELNAAAKKRGIRTIARMSPDLNWEMRSRLIPNGFSATRKAIHAPPRMIRTCTKPACSPAT